MQRVFVICSLMLLSLVSNAQSEKDSLAALYFSDLQLHLQEEDYSSASKDLSKLNALRVTMPDEVAFYYGVVQYYTGNKDRAKSGFTKYLMLSSNEAAFRDSTYTFLRLIDCETAEHYEAQDTCGNCKGLGELEVRCLICEGTGKEYCQACNGNGVSVVHAAIGDRYQDCTHCQGTGLVSCSICHGSLKRKVICSACGGRRSVKVWRKCY